MTDDLDPLVLLCGHVAAESERYRGGDEHWCVMCCSWQPGRRAELARARSILDDHRAGQHEEYDTRDGCMYLGCDDAFWVDAHERARETAP